MQMIGDPVEIVLMLVILLFSLTVHEAAHAAMGNFCGEDRKSVV